MVRVHPGPQIIRSNREPPCFSEVIGRCGGRVHLGTRHDMFEPAGLAWSPTDFGASLVRVRFSRTYVQVRVTGSEPAAEPVLFEGRLCEVPTTTGGVELDLG